jgi:hypothetical protein
MQNFGLKILRYGDNYEDNIKTEFTKIVCERR